MVRTYVKTKELIVQVLELKEQGKTNREIGEVYGLTRMQIKNLLYRHRSSTVKMVENNKLSPKT